MSSYITRWCRHHGEWDMDVDNVDECPKCIKLGMTEVQQLRQQIEVMKQAFDELDKELQCKKLELLADDEKRRDELTRVYDELTNLKDAFARLREDRNMHSEMRQANHKMALKQLDENLKLQRQLAVRCSCQFQNGKPIVECGYHQR